MSANFDHYLYCQVTPRQTKTNEYTNAHHKVVKNGIFKNYNISCIKFQKKYYYVIFNEHTGLYYANKQ